MIEFITWLLGYFFIGFLLISVIYFYSVYKNNMYCLDMYLLKYHKEDRIFFIIFYPIIIIGYLIISWFDFLEKTAIKIRNKKNDQ
jgi:hypothetical protein